MRSLKGLKNILLINLIFLGLTSCGNKNNPNEPKVHSPGQFTETNNLSVFYESLNKIDIKTYCAQLTIVFKNDEYSKITMIKPENSIYQISNNNEIIYLCDYIKINGDEFYKTYFLNYEVKENVAYRIDIQITLKDALKVNYCEIFKIFFEHGDHEDEEAFMILDS